MSKHPATVAEEVFPRSVTRRIAPAYRRLENGYYRLEVILGTNYQKYRYDGMEFEIFYTVDAARKLRGLIKSGKMQPEQVPIKYLIPSSAVDAFVDVGAHFGTYSVVGSRLNPDTDVYAFEPDDYNRSVLREVLRENAIAADVRPEVVSGEEGTITFYIDESEGSESHSLAADADLEPVTKECVALSGFLSERGVSSVAVKIDAEGGEAEILRDLFSAPLSRVSGIVELHPEKLDTDTDDVVALLRDESDTCSFLGDSCPAHPRADSIDHDLNRPIYYFQYSSTK
jgi:FkbM family methyltransferase